MNNTDTTLWKFHDDGFLVFPKYFSRKDIKIFCKKMTNKAHANQAN